MAAPRIFVSHGHQDDVYCRDFVAALLQDLGADAEAVWYDERSSGGDEHRQVADQELRQREHFIVILSQAALASDQVNAEIDAGLALLGSGSIRTIQFVTAVACKVPPPLERYRRLEQPDGNAYLPAEAAARAMAVITAMSGTQSAASDSSRPSAISDRDTHLRIGLKYGALLGTAALLVVLEDIVVVPHIAGDVGLGAGNSAVLAIVAIAAMLILTILVGFLPARRTGTMGSAFAAWGVFCLLFNAGVDAPSFLTNIAYGLQFELGYLLILIVFGVPTLVLVVISGFIGRWMAHKDESRKSGLWIAVRLLIALVGILLMISAIWVYIGLFITFDGFGINAGRAFYPLVYQIAWWWSGNESSFASVVIILQIQCLLALLVGLVLFVIAASWQGMREYASPLKWYARVRRIFADLILTNAFIATLLIFVDVVLANVLVVTFQPVGDCLNCTAPPFHPPVLSFVQKYPFQSVALLVTGVFFSTVGFYVAWAAPRELHGRRLVLAAASARMLQILSVITITSIGLFALLLFPYPYP